uniref:Uncharacterized protein n=1 Tax=Chaetoceros debilis TaxID=122233 RepID=A0A7S3PZD7_9STRA
MMKAIDIYLLCFAVLGNLSFAVQVMAFQLTTSSTVNGITRDELHNFLATPTNWPKIVASSHSVKCPSFSTNSVESPLAVGDYVEEVFGLPPILPLSVVWQCIVSDVSRGKLEFSSESGVPMLAKKCKMNFTIEDATDGCRVELAMEFEPENPIVYAGIPILSADNSLALKVLLPMAIANR